MLMNNEDPFALKGDPLPKPKHLRGLGDVVHLVAAPVAEIVDKLINTSLAGCSGCAERREFLNKVVPFTEKD